MPALAFTRSARGKLTFVRDSKTREYVRDSRYVYAVLRTVSMRKGEYFFDETGAAGTLLHTVKNDRLTTGSRMDAHASDGMKQVVDVGLILSGTAKAERRRVGSWLLRLSWKTLQAEPVTDFLEVG